MKSSDLLVSIDRVLPAPPDVVFSALTDRDLFSRWIGPEGSTVDIEEFELALGGRIAFTVSIPGFDALIRLYGFYEVIDAPDRLVHSWAVEGENEISTVVFQLEPHELGTHLTLTHHGLTRPEDVENNGAGWNACLDRLETLIVS
jgi:uncharacterized protein YndB with AHSA1/START domain